MPRAESCFSGVIEFFVPPHPPAYTPTAVRLPTPRAALSQIGVSLVRSPAGALPPALYSALRLRRAHEPRFVFRLAQEGSGVDAFCKYVSLTRSEFHGMMADLRGAFPEQLESNFVVDVKKLWVFRVRRVVSETEQDLLHTLRQLVMIPEVLESAFFHRALVLSSAETLALVGLAEHIRATKKRAQLIHALVDEETKRITNETNLSDFEYAELVFSKLLISSRYLCSEPIRQPLLLYDHEMLFKLAPPSFPHRVRVATGPGEHIYFTLRRRRHRGWCLSDTFNNELAELVEEGDADDHEAPPLAPSGPRLSALRERPRFQRFTMRRAFPACRVHQRSQSFQLIPCITAVGDRQTKALEIHSVPSCGAFASLGTIFAEPEAVAAKSSTLASYKITARHDSGFTFFLGTYARKTRQRVQLLVHPGQDLIAMLMLAQLVDSFVDS
ncbi:hypothetical protein PybrP1_005779 [[Pythium] brassicae (nom. inval.)]|nr:hypothetical protein PybrP1_005779 [[Pythium] brassicae (nom. inval.)]